MNRIAGRFPGAGFAYVSWWRRRLFEDARLLMEAPFVAVLDTSDLSGARWFVIGDVLNETRVAGLVGRVLAGVEPPHVISEEAPGEAAAFQKFVGSTIVEALGAKPLLLLVVGKDCLVCPLWLAILSEAADLLAPQVHVGWVNASRNDLPSSLHGVEGAGEVWLFPVGGEAERYAGPRHVAKVVDFAVRRAGREVRVPSFNGTAAQERAMRKRRGSG